ncbi:PLP-dependent aminotransferase family protein [Eubacteriales bacterium OttesenSCG-928-G02]|nr:PLP-dependent aminotransferase family protein [Eubacteriales bacterium OttesenSCG-928-G02]
MTKFNFSDKVKDLKPSAIREIFKSLSDPDMISFGAGNPSPESFPIEQMKLISDDIFANDYVNAFQYSVTEGYPTLRNQISQRLKDKFNTGTDDDSLIITTGGQQGIDLAAKVLCNEGDVIICENPSFIGALNAFRAYNVNLVGVDVENDGINIEQLEKALEENKNTKMLYLIPTFQNPSGITMSLEKRKAVLDLAVKFNVVILEDNPYGELRFSGEDVPTIKSLDTTGNVLYCSSFSKILSAGMRLGFICGNQELIQKIVVVKQVNDVHTNIFFQILASKFISEYGLDSHIEKIKKLYKYKSDLMTSEFDKNFKGEVTYNKPEGGLFLWGTLKKGMDSDQLVKSGISEKVAIVGGSTFLPNPGVSNSFRMNYSTPSDEQIIIGMERLYKAYKKIGK